MLPIYIAFAYYLLLTRVIPGLYENWKRSRQLRLKNRAIIFSRYPTPGNTKTRLIPTLGPAGAAGLQLLMTDHLVRVLKRACLNVKQLCVEIRYFGGSPLEMNYWTGKHQDPLITHREQGGEDLGQKMGNAMKDAFNEGASNVVIVGSDIPGISTDILSEAFELLSQPEYDVILGPATDGGYYAVGMSSGACKAIGERREIVGRNYY
jgi:rSAM/selenodomain-associated transferase 1